MKTRTPTKKDIDALLKYLPAFSAPGREFGRWVGGGTKDGAIQMPGLSYDEDVREFFRLAAQEVWRDRACTTSDAARMVGDDEFIEHADLGQICAMLSFAVRGEKFADGHWLAMLKEGKVQALLRRLRALREQV